MENVVIVGALRTAAGKFAGSLGGIPASTLGANVIKALLEKTGVKPEQVDEVILGQVLTTATGQNPARQASLVLRPSASAAGRVSPSPLNVK